VDTGSGKQGPDPASPGGGTSEGAAAAVASPWMGSVGLWMGLAGLSAGFLFFFVFFNLINRGGQATTLKNKSFTVTLVPRLLRKTTWLRVFAHLDRLRFLQ